ncbi:MAG: ATP phosphoribosyltransferase regulatory subunit, partial [Pseudomonadota bacterium]
LRTTQRRKQALMRHIWRPARFRALIERFSGRAEIPASRAALLERQEIGQTEAPLIGLRSQAEIETRIEALRKDRDTAPLSVVELEALDALLAVAGQADQALVALREIAVDLPAIGDALDRLEARLEALSAQDIDISALDFEASYGRTQMEYYDGFVFGLYDATRPHLPPVASGGRYDALTRHLGQGREAAAVGGVIRPDLLLGLQHATQNAAQGAIR